MSAAARLDVLRLCVEKMSGFDLEGRVRPCAVVGSMEEEDDMASGREGVLVLGLAAVIREERAVLKARVLVEVIGLFLLVLVVLGRGIP